MGTGSLPRGYNGRGMTLTTHPHLAPIRKKELSYNFMELIQMCHRNKKTTNDQSADHLLFSLFLRHNWMSTSQAHTTKQ
jgi:hypothetical protein